MPAQLRVCAGFKGTQRIPQAAWTSNSGLERQLSLVVAVLSVKLANYYKSSLPATRERHKCKMQQPEQHQPLAVSWAQANAARVRPCTVPWQGPHISLTAQGTCGSTCKAYAAATQARRRHTLEVVVGNCAQHVRVLIDSGQQARKWELSSMCAQHWWWLQKSTMPGPVTGH